MADPRRWLDDDGASRAAVDLLRALEPPKAAPAAVRSALGQQLAGMVAAGGTHAAWGIGWTKLVVLSVAVAGTGTGAVWTLSHRSAMPVTPSARVEVAERSVEVQEPPPVAGSEPAATADTASARRIERPRAVTAGTASAEPRDRLAEEEAILEQARQALAQDPARALTLLRRHQNRFAQGELTAERMYLSVDCLSRLGKREAAKREADALLERYPNSAYARRVPLLLSAPGR